MDLHLTPEQIAALNLRTDGGFLILISIPGIVAGIGLLKYKSWARILAIILGVLNLESVA